MGATAASTRWPVLQLNTEPSLSLKTEENQNPISYIKSWR